MNLQFARGSQHTQVKLQGRLHVDVGVHDRVRQADAAQMQIRCPGKALDGVPDRLGQRDVGPLCGHRPVHLGGTRDIDCRCGFIEQQLSTKLTCALLDRVGRQCCHCLSSRTSVCHCGPQFVIADLIRNPCPRNSWIPGRARDDSFGARDDSFGARDDSFGVRDDSFGARDDSFGVRHDKLESAPNLFLPVIAGLSCHCGLDPQSMQAQSQRDTAASSTPA